jgi:hypothetical protein
VILDGIFCPSHEEFNLATRILETHVYIRT